MEKSINVYVNAIVFYCKSMYALCSDFNEHNFLCMDTLSQIKG